MNHEDELQQLFESAGSAVELEPGSLSSVKGRAAKRTRNTRMMTTGALCAVLLAVGVAGWSTLVPGQESIEVATGGPLDTDSGDPAETVDDEAPVTEEDFTYLGAFMAPAGDIAESTFAFGGATSAFNPAGDPGGDDDFSGSLFMSGHPRENPGVAEIAIPEPFLHGGSTDGLPVAEVLQPFADITSGRAAEFVGSQAVGGDDEFRYGGLEVVDGPDGSRLHWTVWQFNNVTDSDVPGHGHSSLDLSQPDPQGPFFAGEANGLVTAGYLFAVPDDFADQHFDGKRLLTGHKDEPTTTTRSWGPPFFAYAPPESAEPNSRVDAIELASYLDGDQLADYGRADIAPGGSWVTTSDGASAVVTVGRRGLGEVREGAAIEGDCDPYAGVHADPYEPQIMFYRPADLAAVAAGDIEPSELQPYRRWNPAEHLISTCRWYLSSISFDAENNLAYVVQTEADTSQDEFSPIPVIHVFQL